MVENVPFQPERSFLLLDDSSGAGPCLLFRDALSVECSTGDGDVRAAFARLRAATAQEHWVAGWLAYEAGYALEPKLAKYAAQARIWPLMYFGVYAAAQHLRSDDVTALLSANQSTHFAQDDIAVTPAPHVAAHYHAQVEKILHYINAGDIYQANFTFQAAVRTGLNAVALYVLLRPSQRVKYGALWHDGADNWALSFSPELFFECNDSAVKAQPMKGTLARAPAAHDDALRPKLLAADEKNRAENLMIVDLMRNDMARVSVPGSVRVESLFDVQTLMSVHQMTSQISATLAPGKDAFDVLEALFPCGSITGAPKIRAMEIIAESEPQPRGIYCGSFGYVHGDSACFSVAIRTLTKRHEDEHWAIGLGGGIVADSTSEAEFEECLLKSKFLRQPLPEFDLLETFAWQPGTGFRHLHAHLARMRASAQYWKFSFDADQAENQLNKCAAQFSAPMRVRLLLSRTGSIAIQAAPLLEISPPVRVKIVPAPLFANNVFLYHKTSQRSAYDAARAALPADIFDCLFVNARGQVSEGSFTNIFVQKGSKLLTPPLHHGVLPGVLRAQLLASGACTEQPLTIEDLKTADDIFVGNSLRGLLRAKLDF